MDSRNRTRDKARVWISNRRNKSIVIASVVLITIVLLQAGNLKPTRTMCPLFSNCQLRGLDLQRMQIALSKSGLNEYEIKENQLLVPHHQQARYLQAISEQNAVPAELQDSSTSAALTNPFLTHSQQLSLQRESRNKKLQERLMLLPFVDQAWFEMDESAVRGALYQPDKSAVVTIRPKLQQPLREQQIHTLRQIVCGGVSGLNQDRIVIVDLTTGFAHQGSALDENWEQKLNVQRVAFARQQHLENRLRETLQRYEGLRVNVLVEAEADPEEKTAMSPTENLQEPGPVNLAVDISDELGLVGANGQVAIHLSETVLQASPEATGDSLTCQSSSASTSIHLSAHTLTEPVINLTSSREKVTIIVEVPEKLLADRFGGNDGAADRTSKLAGSHRDQNRLLQNWLDKFKPELEQNIRPVLSMQGLSAAPVVYNVIPSTMPTPAGWRETAKTICTENWPSLVVLLTGLLLISLIAERRQPKRGSDGLVDTVSDDPANSIRGITRPTEDSASDECVSAKAQLSQMIEKNPDAAARVIENWIRDAA